MKIKRENYKNEVKKLLEIRRWQSVKRIKYLKRKERRQNVVSKSNSRNYENHNSITKQ